MGKKEKEKTDPASIAGLVAQGIFLIVIIWYVVIPVVKCQRSLDSINAITDAEAARFKEYIVEPNVNGGDRKNHVEGKYDEDDHVYYLTFHIYNDWYTMLDPKCYETVKATLKKLFDKYGHSKFKRLDFMFYDSLKNPLYKCSVDFEMLKVVNYDLEVPGDYLTSTTQ